MSKPQPLQPRLDNRLALGFLTGGYLPPGKKAESKDRLLRAIEKRKQTTTVKIRPNIDSITGKVIYELK